MSRKARLGAVLRWFLVAGLSTAVVPAGAATLTEVTGFGSNPGNLRMFKYVPDGLPVGRPVVVAMHGCTQSAAAYDTETGWTKYADLWGFALLLPEQKSANNGIMCFRWFESGHVARGAGEPLSIKQMVDRMAVDHGSDTTRVHVTGLSAGGAMTAVMLATYPDVFAAGAVVAGLPYRCAPGSSASSCQNPGVDKTPTQWGDLVRGASSHAGPWPRVSIWHGTDDYTVRPVNATELVDQWTNVHGADQTPDVQDTVKGYPHKVYNAGSTAVVELYTLTGMGHGVPVNPGAALDQCGTAGAYVIDTDICASYHIARFFGLDNSDTVAPAVSISAPANGATVSGIVTVSATATDNIGVTAVEFLVDGALLDTDTASPWSASWNTATASNGTHALLARARDAAGNVGASTTVSVTVTGGVEDTTPPTVNLTFPGNGATVSGTITLAATATDDSGVAGIEFFVDGLSIGTGTPSGQAGPWTLAWNTTTVSEGAHALSVTARDAKGNAATDADTTVTVSQNVAALAEGFSNLDGAGDFADTSGWTLGGYEASAENRTVGGPASQSALGYASSGVGCVGGLRTETLSRSVVLGDNPKLSYFRKLDLKAQINTMTTASFKAKVNGAIVDQQTVTNANYAETAWTTRSDISLAAYAGQTVTLAFEVAANSNVCIEAWGKAWLDDITVNNPQQADDKTPPTVNITAPANGATVGGTLDITATASDNVAVTKVEFYVDGSLLEIDSATPYATTWNSNDAANGSHTLMARAYDAAGNMGSDNDTAITVSNGAGGAVTLTVDNIDAQDGYVKALAGGGSPAVGTLAALASGRGTDGKHNRTVLSFDTAALPDSATITRAYLTVEYSSASGDPWANPAGNQLVVDVKSGCLGACTIETGDWAAAPTATAVANIVKFTSGVQHSGDFASAGLAAINKTGTTQVKLRFSQDPSATNYLFIKNGTPAKLTVEYQP